MRVSLGKIINPIVINDIKYSKKIARIFHVSNFISKELK
jgi:hypothetical protein